MYTHEDILSPQEHVIYASIAPYVLYDPNDDPDQTVWTGDADAEAQSWGLPSLEVVPRVAASLRHVLAANNINVDDVVVSGYDRLEAQNSIDETKADLYADYEDGVSEASLAEKIMMINAELAELHEAGILTDAKRRAANIEITNTKIALDQLRQAPPQTRHMYYFAPVEALNVLNNENGNQSTFYAGGETGATIGVYSRSALAELCLDDPVGDSNALINDDPEAVDRASVAYLVKATPEQVEATKVAEVHIRYGEDF